MHKERQDIGIDNLYEQQRKCKTFYGFLQTFWSEVIPQKPVYNWHIKAICDELEIVGRRVAAGERKEYDLVINVPPGTSKTTIASIMYPAWLWTIMPEMRVLSASYSASLSSTPSVKSRDIIQSDLYKRLFPSVKIRKDIDAKSNYENTKGGQRYATSVGGTVTGQHGHIRILDDPLNPKGYVSQSMIEEANGWIDATWSSRNVDHAVTTNILVMQRIHDSDPSAHYLDKGRSMHICLPAEMSEKVSPPHYLKHYKQNGGLLDPVRLDYETLEQSRTDLGSIVYQTQFGQTTTEEGGNHIKDAWLLSEFSMEDLPPLEWKMLIDGAYTKNIKNDPSSFLVYAYHSFNWYYRSFESYRLELPALAKKLVERMDDIGVASSHVEPKASGYPLIQTVADSTDKIITSWQNVDITGGQAAKSVYFMSLGKSQKMQLIPPQAESSRLHFLKGQNWAELKAQLTRFPKAKHDEAVDLVAYSIAIEKFGHAKGRSVGDYGNQNGGGKGKRTSGFFRG